ncbi:MAG: hypothetical protein HRT89_16380 [Lentisphaeria bacterium]|nr:hypothetical protein [Lentisphaeria bacterium]NQZ69637.1 hypothetical protein [Lentisphaeria bacterium]
MDTDELDGKLKQYKAIYDRYFDQIPEKEKSADIAMATTFLLMDKEEGSKKMCAKLKLGLARTFIPEKVLTILMNGTDESVRGSAPFYCLDLAEYPNTLNTLADLGHINIPFLKSLIYEIHFHISYPRGSMGDCMDYVMSHRYQVSVLKEVYRHCRWQEANESIEAELKDIHGSAYDAMREKHPERF